MLLLPDYQAVQVEPVALLVAAQLPVEPWDRLVVHRVPDLRREPGCLRAVVRQPEVRPEERTLRAVALAAVHQQVELLASSSWPGAARRLPPVARVARVVVPVLAAPKLPELRPPVASVASSAARAQQV
jgi:hypothetical protein